MWCFALLALLVYSEAAYTRDTTWPHWPATASISGVTAIGIDQHGHTGVEIHVAQRNHASPPIFVFNSAGTLLRTWGEDALSLVHGFRVQRWNGQSFFWATDVGTGLTGHTVKRFASNGTLLTVLGTPGDGGSGTSPFQFDAVADIAFDDDGNVYIGDGDAGKNNRVSAWSAPDFDNPTWLLGNSHQQRNKRKSTASATQHSKRKTAAPVGFSSPHSVSVDHLARLWIADRGNNRTVTVDTTGTVLGTWSCWPNSGVPWGVASWHGARRLIVSDGTRGVFYVADINTLPLPDDCNVLTTVNIRDRPGTAHLLEVDQRNGNVYLAVIGDSGQTSANKYVYSPDLEDTVL